MRVRLLVVPIVLAAAACGEAAPPVSPPDDDPVPASLSLDVHTITFGALASQRGVTALVRNAAGDTLTDAPVTWTHRASGITTVSSTGVVTAVANGSDTVIAAAGTLADTVFVTVAQVPVGLNLAGARDFTFIGDSYALTATVVDSNNRPVPGHVIAWATSDSSVYLSTAGQVTAAGRGSAVITASAAGLSSQVTLAIVLTGPVGPPILGAEVPCTGGMIGPFPCSNINLLSYLPLSGLGAPPGVDVNDVWGWTDPVTGIEWAIVGRRDGMAFISLEDPTQPEYRAWLATGGDPNYWHDVKILGNYAFVVADGAGPHGMQVFDLRHLREPSPGYAKWYTPDALYAGVAAVHNIAINEATGFAYLVGANAGGTTCGGGLHMVDLSSPLTPTFAGCFADPLTGRVGTGYTHDVQCVVYAGPDPDYTGREICLGSNETHLSIADVTAKGAPVAVSRATYPAVRYAHQGWLTGDHRYFFMNDELDEAFGGAATTRTLIWDVEDLDDPILIGQFFGPTSATDHNHYIVGDRLYASNYQYGIRVLDISTPGTPVQIAHLDTAPTQANTPGYGGSWSNYPFFASGIVVVTSDQEGLFVLRVP